MNLIKLYRFIVKIKQIPKIKTFSTLAISLALVLIFSLVQECKKVKAITLNQSDFTITTQDKAERAFKRDSEIIIEEVFLIKTQIDKLDEKLDSIAIRKPYNHKRLQSTIDRIFNRYDRDTTNQTGCGTCD